MLPVLALESNVTVNGVVPLVGFAANDACNGTGMPSTSMLLEAFASPPAPTAVNVTI
jgi:hypothetical protein